MGKDVKKASSRKIGNISGYMFNKSTHPTKSHQMYKNDQIEFKKGNQITK